jgi:tRNA(fMet)-specific endonuclease VapC
VSGSLLDTNAVIALMAPDPILHAMLIEPAEVYLPAVALGELYFGAAKSARAFENLTRLEEFAAGRPVLACDHAVAREYGAIKNELRLRGRPIPTHDVWIAAIARRHGLTLISRDSHFDEVDGLAVQAW